MSVTIQAVTDAETAVGGYRIEILGPKKHLSPHFTDWNNHNREVPDIEIESSKTESGALPRVLRTENETLFRPREAHQSNRRQMYRLKNHQLDLNKDRVDVEQASRADIDIKLHLMIALGRQLEMPRAVVLRATRLLFTIDNRVEGLPSDAVGFCIYVHLINDETEKYESHTPRLFNQSSPGKGPIYWPGRPPKMNCRHFQRVAEHLCSSRRNVTEGVIQSLLQRLLAGGLQEKESNYVPTEDRVQRETKNVEDRRWTPSHFDDS